jgi:GNAT superfamily N-acetyltransferase
VGATAAREGSEAFRVGFLSDHAAAIPQIARWVWESWGYGDLAACESDLRKSRPDVMPVGYVALRDDRPLGVVNLIECNLPPRCHLSPWLAGLYVHPSYRLQGVGTALARFLEDHAASLGFEDVYLYTANAEGFYSRLGWGTVEQVRWEGEQVALMRRAVSRCSPSG